LPNRSETTGQPRRSVSECCPGGEFPYGFRRAVHAVGKRLGQEATSVRFEEPRVELIPVGAAHPGKDR